jgi:hypothetical protein
MSTLPIPKSPFSERGLTIAPLKDFFRYIVDSMFCVSVALVEGGVLSMCAFFVVF